jgi:3-hydroxyisobutyrate dehydrogenase-like beta-hydroxyacid dehydrogenase
MQVSVLGLGQMGTAIAERLLDAGHTVRVWNRSRGKAEALVAKGATELDSPAEGWASEFVVVMVADSVALTELALGAHGLACQAEARGKFLIDMSTVSAECSAKVAAAAADQGIRYVRAPVRGNPGVVRAGNLAIVASGDEGDVSDAKVILADVGPHVFYAGEGEAARIVKLALNLMIAGTAQLLSEALTLAESHGVDRAKLLEITSASAIGSPFVKYKSAPLLVDDYASTFSTRLMRKDLDMVLASGAAGNVPLPVTATVQQLLQACVSTGLGDLDFMSLFIRLKREAGQAS